MLKSLKSQFGGLKIVDRTVLFEYFDIKSIDSDSMFFVLLSQSLYNLKLNGSRMNMLLLPPLPLL